MASPRPLPSTSPKAVLLYALAPLPYAERLARARRALAWIEDQLDVKPFEVRHG